MGDGKMAIQKHQSATIVLEMLVHTAEVDANLLLQEVIHEKKVY